MFVLKANNRQLHINGNNFQYISHPLEALEVVGRGSETQLQVSEHFTLTARGSTLVGRI